MRAASFLHSHFLLRHPQAGNTWRVRVYDGLRFDVSRLRAAGVCVGWSKVGWVGRVGVTGRRGGVYMPSWILGYF